MRKSRLGSIINHIDSILDNDSAHADAGVSVTIAGAEHCKLHIFYIALRIHNFFN